MEKGYIYKITNLTNNKVYIGQTIDFNKRKQEHINALKAKRYFGQMLCFEHKKVKTKPGRE